MLIYDLLVELLAQHTELPLKGISLAGDIISVDARVQDYDGVKQRKNVQELSSFLDEYEKLFKKTQEIVAAFQAVRNEAKLINDLVEVKRSLIDIGGEDWLRT